MAILNCKMCGGELNVTAGMTVCECEYCGSRQTVPSTNDEKKIKLYERANKLRASCEFDRAYSVYESIIDEFGDEAEAHWGLILCKYGIEYVDDPKTGKKIPTCHRSSYECVLDDEAFEMVMENADESATAVYREQAKEIEEIRKNIIEVSSKEGPYDIFICYKETDENKERTIDSVLAQDVYEALTTKGYRVFFARISLENNLGKGYEPIIFSALNSSKVMLAFGTNYSYFNAVWVKNEWSRFLKMMEKDKEKYLIPCYKDIDAYDMPKEFRHLQAQDMGKVGAIQDLVRGIEKLIVKKNGVEAVKENDTTAALFKRAEMFLVSKDYENADKYLDRVLDISPENEEALLYKLLVEYKCASLDELAKSGKSFTQSRNYTVLMKYCSEETKNKVESVLKEIKDLIEKNKKAKSLKRRKRRIILLSAILSCIVLAFSTILVIGRTKLNFNCTVTDSGVEITGVKMKWLLKKDIVIPNKKRGKNVTSIGSNAFYGFSSLTSVTISDSVTSIGENAFWKCSSLTSVTIPDSVTSIDVCAFDGCSSLTSITIPDSVTSIDYSAFYNCSSLTSITIPDGVTSIGGWAFGGCSSLTSVRIPDSVTSVGDRAFRGCSSLTSITIPDSVTNIGYEAFYGCSSLTSITIPDSVTSIGWGAFSGCSSLSFNEYEECLYLGSKNNPYYALITIKDKTATTCKINENTKIIAGATFEDCSSLTSITIPDGVISIGDSAFDGCKSLKSVVIPDSVISIGYSAFGDCSSLTSITIPDSVIRIGDFAFRYCRSLTSITILDGVTSIGSSAFEDCSSLTSITIPDSVTSIGSSAFSDCISLRRITIPDSVTSIGGYAFSNCNSLTIYCEAESKTSGWDSSWNNSNRPVVWGYNG